MGNRIRTATRKKQGNKFSDINSNLIHLFISISYMIQLKKKKHLAICPISEGKLPASGTIDFSRFRQGYSPD